MPKLPETLGPLKLVEQIGVGRHCQIWSALETVGAGKPPRQSAVKVVVPESAGDAEQRNLLAHEFKVAKSCDHPGVIKIDRAGEEGGLPLLVMELFPHPNLKKQLAQGVDSLAPKVTRIMTELSLAIDHLHARGWVHRDLKPENVLAAPDGRVKLIDLAIASPMPGLLGRLLGGGAGKAQGSPSYMSPEQIRGQQVDARSDVYSLGCLFFELLAGKPPFTAPNQNDLLNKHVSTPPPSIESLNRNVTTAMSKLLREMLAKKPGERPQSMKDVQKTLKSIRVFERAVAPA
jgi:serine/threonine protein kinase